MISNADALCLWVTEAHLATIDGDGITADRLHALAAYPESDAAMERGETWYVREAMHLLRVKAGDMLTPDADDVERKAWRRRRESIEWEVASLLAEHAECIAKARAFVLAERGVAAGTRPALALVTKDRRKTERRRTPRETAADRALRIITGDVA